MTAGIDLRVERGDDGWVLAGPESADVRLVNDYLGYLGDRHYAPGTRRGYAYDLLAFLRWLGRTGGWIKSTPHCCWSSWPPAGVPAPPLPVREASRPVPGG